MRRLPTSDDDEEDDEDEDEDEDVVASEDGAWLDPATSTAFFIFGANTLGGAS